MLSSQLTNIFPNIWDDYSQPGNLFSTVIHWQRRLAAKEGHAAMDRPIPLEIRETREIWCFSQTKGRKQANSAASVVVFHVFFGHDTAHRCIVYVETSISSQCGCAPTNWHRNWLSFLVSLWAPPSTGINLVFDTYIVQGTTGTTTSHIEDHIY